MILPFPFQPLDMKKMDIEPTFIVVLRNVAHSAVSDWFCLNSVVENI